MTDDKIHADSKHNSPPSGDNPTVPIVLAICLAIGAGYGAFKWYQVQAWQAEKQVAVQRGSLEPLTEFVLEERSGSPFRSEEMKGKVWVASYFFTTCMGSCTRLNQNIQYLNELPELADVTWVSITCDPATDSLELLNRYADHYQADPERWLFCRGEMETISRIGKGMQLDILPRGHKDYGIVFDRQGKIRGLFDITSKSQSQRLRLLLTELLAEESPGTPEEESVASAEGNAV